MAADPPSQPHTLPKSGNRLPTVPSNIGEEIADRPFGAAKSHKWPNQRWLYLERVLFSWKQSEWMNFSHLTRRRPQSDAVASVEDFDDVRAEKTPPAVR
jgi:hypothetical protein